MRKFRSIALSNILLLLISPALFADGLGAIEQRGTVRIGVAEFVPWTFRNINGDLEGYEIDVGRQVANDMNVEVEFIVYELDEIVDALNSAEIDFIAAGLAITPQRAMRVEYSLPYVKSGTTLVTNTQLLPNAGSVDDLNKEGNVIVTVSDSYSSQFAPYLFDLAVVTEVGSEREMEKALVSGDAHGALTNLPEADYLVARHRDTLAAPLADPLVESAAGFAVKRGNQTLLNFMNAWIVSRQLDTWLPQTYDHWFSGNEWIVTQGDSQ